LVTHSSTCQEKDLVQQSNNVDEETSHVSAGRVAVHVSLDQEAM
jgi:hypothetical protein